MKQGSRSLCKSRDKSNDKEKARKSPSAGLSLCPSSLETVSVHARVRVLVRVPVRVRACVLACWVGVGAMARTRIGKRPMCASKEGDALERDMCARKEGDAGRAHWRSVTAGCVRALECLPARARARV